MRQCKHNLSLCDGASWQILIIKPTRCTNFSNLFWNETLHGSDNSSAHHQGFFTAHTAMVWGWNCSSILILLESCLQTCMTYIIAVCTVKNFWWWAKGLSETCRAIFLVVVALLVDQQRCYHHAPTVKPEAANAVVSSWWWARKRPKHVEPHINVK